MYITTENRSSTTYRGTVDSKSDKDLAELKKLIKTVNENARKSFEESKALCIRYNGIETWESWQSQRPWRAKQYRVKLYGRCGKGGYNRRTQCKCVPHDEAVRFDVYVVEI